MAQFILSTCGTSLLTNGRSEDEKKLVNAQANVRHRKDMDTEKATILSKIIEQVQERLTNASLQDVARMSAELNALIRFYDGKAPSDRDYHVFLCTDTWLGEESAKLAEMWLNQQGCKVEVRRQTDLQTASLPEFQLALSDITRWCEEHISAYRQAGYRIVFNLTGGFKSVQGFLQTLAMFYADEVVYIFESQKELLHIPRLPVSMDEKKITVIQEHLKIFRRFGKNLVVDNANDIPETLLMRIDESVTLSPWGQLVWEQTKKTIYSECVHPSPSDNLRYSESFERSVRQLAPERRVIINERIDDLANFLETKVHLRSLDFKPLQGKVKLPSTHECDAWADQDAKRMFGHFEGDIFVLDSLDKGLH